MSWALVSHQEVVESRSTLVSEHDRTLQCHFVEISKNGDKKAGTYRAKLTFSLIDAQAGKVLAQQTTEGTLIDIKSGPTIAFYTCIHKAAETFLQRTDFMGIQTALSM